MAWLYEIGVGKYFNQSKQENNATELNATNEIAFGTPTKWSAATKHKNLKILEFLG